jgi:hypothetical protein
LEREEMTGLFKSAIQIQPLQMAKKSHSGKFASAISGPGAGPGRGWYVGNSLSAMQLGRFDIFRNPLALCLLYDVQASFPMRL